MKIRPFPFFAPLLLVAAVPRARAQNNLMQDNFTYTASNLNGHAPDAAGSGTWSTDYSGSSNISTCGGYTSAPTVSFSGGGGSGATATATVIDGQVTWVTVTNGGSGYTSAPTVSFSGGGGNGITGMAIVSSGSVSQVTVNSGSQAVPVVNGGIPGADSAVAQYAFTPAANTLYTLRVTCNFIGLMGSAAGWMGAGFSNQINGGGFSSNIAPWILLRPQSTAGSTPGNNGFVGNTIKGTGTTPAANFAAPITVTVTWNTSTGQAQYYLNNDLQTSWTTTTTTPSGGTYYAFFQAFQTGSTVNVLNVSLTSQPLPLPVTSYAPQGSENPAGTGSYMTTDFWNLFQSTVEWPCALAQTKIFQVDAATLENFYSGSGATATAVLSGVTGVTVTSGGSGYTSVPTVNLSGGGGTGAFGTAIVSGGQVTGVILTSGGSGYTSAPMASFSGGGGSGAAGTATVGVGQVTGVTMTGGGSGYTRAPIVTLTGGGGSGAAATAVLSGGQVTGVNVISGGSGYTSVPTVSVTAGSSDSNLLTLLDFLKTNSISLCCFINALPPSACCGSGVQGYGAGGIGQVIGVTVTDGGTSYTSAPTVSFSGGGGSGAAATAIVYGGQVTGVSVSSGGSGYTSAPTASFSGGGGSGAAATASTSDAQAVVSHLQYLNSAYSKSYTVSYVCFNEPLTWAHYFTGASSCQTAVATLASQCATTMQVFAAAFASAQPCDVEAPDSWPSTWKTDGQLAAFLSDFSADFGGPLAFMQYDHNWTVPLSTNGMTFVTQMGSVPFAMIYNGDYPQGLAAQASSANWTLCAQEGIQEYNAALNAPVVLFTGGGGIGATGTATVSGGAVTGVTVTGAGSGYTSAPTVNIFGGGGSGALGTAAVSGGAVTAVTVTSGGSGYMSLSAAPLAQVSIQDWNVYSTNTLPETTASAQTAVIDFFHGSPQVTEPPPVLLQRLSKSGLFVYATDPTDISNLEGAGYALGGPVTGVSMATLGTGYTSAPTVNFLGGGGSGATATAIVSSGQVAAVTVTNGGSGYTSAPTVSFSLGGGSGATASSTVSSYDIAGVEPLQSCSTGLVPLYRYYNSTSGVYALATTSTEISTLLGEGFAFNATLGYVWPASSNGSQGGFALYEFENGSAANFYYSESAAPQPGFTSNCIECYVCPRW